MYIRLYQKPPSVREVARRSRDGRSYTPHQPHHAQRRKHRRGEEETEIRRAGEHRACSEVIGNQHRGKQQGAERLPPGEQHAADHHQHQRETGIPCQPRENRFGAQTVDVAQRAVQQAGRNLGCQAEGFGAGIDVRRNPPESFENSTPE